MIRPFTLFDLPSILGIERQAFPKSPYDWATFVNLYYLYGKTFCVYVDLSLDPEEPGKDQLLGYIVFSADGHLISLAVHPEHRRRGIGRRLLEKALSLPHIKKVWAEVRRSNRGAQAFYLKAGFQIIGEVPNYYGREDALIILWTPSSQTSLTS